MHKLNLQPLNTVSEVLPETRIWTGEGLGKFQHDPPDSVDWLALLEEDGMDVQFAGSWLQMCILNHFEMISKPLQAPSLSRLLCTSMSSGAHRAVR